MRPGASTMMEDLLKPTIVLKPHPPKVLARSATLQPLMIVARECLPLSSLDLISPTGDLHPSPSRLYESHIRILDLESRRGSGPHLLVARLDVNGSLYAVEQHHEKKGLYTVCRLGGWVSVEELAAKATIACQQLLKLSRSEGEKGTSQPMTTPALHKAQNKKRLAIEALQSVVRKKGRTHSTSTLPTLSESDRATSVAPESTQATSVLGSDIQGLPRQESQVPESAVLPSTPPCAPEPAAPPTGEELCERIRKQYWEALYHSKGSLAYFPKGSLSRARAAFHLDSDSTLNMTDLVDYLKSLVMTMTQMNKKYQETIPNIIKELKTHVESSDEGKRRKRARKMKLGRNGLYPTEEQQIRSWWTSNKPDLKDGEAGVPESDIKSYIALLRIRETQLQMILILEILALEPLAATDNGTESQLPGVKTSVEPEKAETTKKPGKRKQNLADVVDMHADLLCIWQSTSSNEMRLLEDSQATDHAREGQKAQRASSEPLRDFCVDIIMPFFHARLPEVCDSLNKKLGGPVMASPPKPKQSKPKPKPTKQPRPGSITKRAQPSKPASVRRALSDEQAERARRSMSRGPSKAVAALLSATETVIPGIKREASDPLNLASIPRKKSDLGLLRDKSTNILSRSNSFAGVMEDPKVKKKAIVEAELQDAISALRKPNRQLVGKTIMEAVEKRGTLAGSGMGLSQLKKARKPPVRVTDQQVQVKATPMHSRFRQVESQPVRPFMGLILPSGDGDDAVPPSSASVIPATAPRGGFRDALVSERVENTPAGHGNGKSKMLEVVPGSPATDRVMATPAKPSAKSGGGFLYARTPARSGADVISATPPVRNIRDMFRTPVKPKVASQATTTSFPAAGGGAEQGENLQKKKSVYEALGWDNEFDDLS